MNIHNGRTSIPYATTAIPLTPYHSLQHSYNTTISLIIASTTATALLLQYYWWVHVTDLIPPYCCLPEPMILANNLEKYNSMYYILWCIESVLSQKLEYGFEDSGKRGFIFWQKPKVILIFRDTLTKHRNDFSDDAWETGLFEFELRLPQIWDCLTTSFFLWLRNTERQLKIVR